MSISLKIEQLDEVEIIPGVVWTLCNMEIKAEVDDDGCIDEISMQYTKGWRKDRWIKITSASTEHRHLWLALKDAIEREFGDKIGEHVNAVNPEEPYDRPLPQEMR